MSGRIRSIKPEWLEDERMAMASSDARVLSIALLLLADDHGNGRASLVMLAGRVFPGKALETVAKALAELEGWFVSLYEVEGQHYFSIRNWEKHQKVDKPGKPRVPKPSDTPENIRETLESVRASRGSRSYAPDPDPDRGPDPDPDPDPGESARETPATVEGEPSLLATRAKRWLKDPARASLADPAPWAWRETIEVVAYFDQVFPGTPTVIQRWGDPRLEVVMHWFAEGKTPADLRVVIDGVRLDDHYANNPQFQTLTLILRDESQIDRFTRLAKAGPRPPERIRNSGTALNERVARLAAAEANARRLAGETQ